MRTRVLLIVAAVLAGTVAVTPASADECLGIEPVYAVGAGGELVEQRYCVGHPGTFLPPRTIATFDTADVPRLFWGGLLPDGGAALYGVTGTGALWWFRQDAATGWLDPPVQVGAASGALFGTGDGTLYGVDGQGDFVHWRHDGWATGTGSVEGPYDVGSTCIGTRPVDVGKNASVRYVGLADDPARYVYCGPSGVAQHASLLPDGLAAGSATSATSPGVTYALTASDRRIVRLVLAGKRWRQAATTGAGYTAVFTGRTIYPPPDRLPWEWQFPWYGGDPDPYPSTTFATISPANRRGRRPRQR